MVFNNSLFDEIVYPFDAHTFSYYTYKGNIPRADTEQTCQFLYFAHIYMDILKEVSTPNNDVYKLADDIKFRIDSDGFAIVNGEKTDCIKMVNVPRYKVVFHENNPEIEYKN